MRKTNSTSWGRLVLALIAVLVIAGPGMVIAGPGSKYPKPVSAVLVGPNSVAVNGSASYKLDVSFSDGTSAIVPNSQVTFKAVKGSISSNGDYLAPSSKGRDSLSGSFTSEGVTVTGAKIVFVN